MVTNFKQVAYEQNLQELGGKNEKKQQKWRYEAKRTVLQNVLLIFNRTLVIVVQVSGKKK